MTDQTGDLLQRDWLVGAPRSADAITVFQWNCLADWASDSFPRVAADFLGWEYRKPRIIAEILRADPDIVCLQEVDHYEDLKSALMPKYDGYFKSKGVNPGTPSRDGGAIFWNRNRLTPKGNVNLHYAETCGMPTMKQVMLSPQFEFKLQSGSSASIRVVATHLKAKKGFDEARRMQCEAMARFLNQEGTPLDLAVVCGDFNTDRESNAVTALLENTKAVDLESTYYSVSESHTGIACEPEWTTWKIRDEVKKKTIDFIFHDQRSSWKPVDVWKIPENHLIDEEVALPCESYPSDHLALATTFELVG